MRTTYGAIAAAIVIAATGSWWVVGDREQIASRILPPPARSPAVADRKIAADPFVEPQSSRVVTSADDALAPYASEKYQFLLTGMFEKPVDERLLLDALLERERIAVHLNTARQSHDDPVRRTIPDLQARVVEADGQIRALLHPTDYAAYELLKDSDIEQYQLGDYAAGISNVAPLSPADRRAILLTKLNYKRYFRQVLFDSGVLNPDLSPAEKQQAIAGISRALEEYKNSYLEEVRQYLFDDEQYALLRNYESSEFEAELAKLRSMAGG
ncbi:hypothetical protein HNQ60_003610 [Povalibacter uvarum]|uniref:Uncharacterized protein n=1 Tax=Povalibacter uvarum TaxID=732238 RepID=A0A841HPM3_9GAMM|nr:hypothetical protein [Povalibacter uvarum]MBB6094723.1 hypothetical protein [Povalibacter uvarum]